MSGQKPTVKTVLSPALVIPVIASSAPSFNRWRLGAVAVAVIVIAIVAWFFLRVKSAKWTTEANHMAKSPDPVLSALTVADQAACERAAARLFWRGADGWTYSTTNNLQGGHNCEVVKKAGYYPMDPSYGFTAGIKVVM